MDSASYDIVILGLTITSSWGNGHATTYRGLVKELTAKKHSVLFLERDMPWYAMYRDMPNPPYGKTELYTSLTDLKNRFAHVIKNADCVIVGSYVPEGVAIGEWVTSTSHGVKAFYDIDTPVTIAKLIRRDYEYLTPALIPQYSLYLSFAGGPILGLLEKAYGAPIARPLYCSVDPNIYFPEKKEISYDLGYMGTFSQDRQESLGNLFIEPARCWKDGLFVVAGPQYPSNIQWPDNVHRVDHLPPSEHRKFYCSQRMTLNLTRADMIQAGYAPSVRLFEAAACGTPIVSDYWEGLNTFFTFGEEILIGGTSDHIIRYLQEISSKELSEIGARARRRILSRHTAAHRVEELEFYIEEARQDIRRQYYISKTRTLRVVE